MKSRSVIRIIGCVLFGIANGWSFTIADDSQGRWMLISRHGECMEINSLKSKLPNLPNISKPSELIEFMNSQGHFVNSKKLSGSAGRAYEIRVVDLSLNLMVVREGLCAKKS
jgi:hypothetical protein